MEVRIGQIRSIFGEGTPMLVLNIEDSYALMCDLDTKAKNTYSTKVILELTEVVGHMDPEKAGLLYG